MKGIILAGDQVDRLHPLSLGTPKQLLPIYNKSMIFYPIETLVEVGVTDIMISVVRNIPLLMSMLLVTVRVFGDCFTYATQVIPEGVAQVFTIGEEFLEKESVCFITGETSS